MICIGKTKCTSEKGLYGVGGQLLEWCKDYLRNRQQRVVVCRGTSDWLTVTSGVPQGSILGPLFFIIYINDLPGVVSDGNKIVLYADDSKLYKVIHSVHDQECFQCDLNKINEWCVNKSDDECLFRLCKLCLLSLEDRRLMADVVFFYKVVNNHVRLTLDSRVRFSRDVDRGYALKSMDTPNLLTSLSRTNLFKFSFMKRTVGGWNSLPLDIREASSVEDFKFLNF